MQPYLFPYIGYFQLIHAADKFLLLDDVAYINKGWINRNRVLINGEIHHFVAPVEGASQNRIINSLAFAKNDKWKSKLDKTIILAYKKGKGFNDFYLVFREILDFSCGNLSEYIANSIFSVCRYLDIKTEVVSSTAMYENSELKGQNRIIDLCLKEKAATYINPSGGKLLYNYKAFEAEGINLKFLQPCLSSYSQIAVKEFVPALSIIDVLMNCDKEFIKRELKNFILA